MKKSICLFLLATLFFGGGCSKESTVSTSPAEQKMFSSTLFPELTFSYPTTYRVEDGTVSRWVVVKKDDTARIEIFHMKDFGDRPFGFEPEETTSTQKDIDGYVPKQQLTKLGFDVWVFYEKDDMRTKDDLMRIVDSMLVKQ